MLKLSKIFLNNKSLNAILNLEMELLILGSRGNELYTVVLKKTNEHCLNDFVQNKDIQNTC